LLKWLCFLLKLHVLPLAGHSILCGNCPPQLWHERFCCFPLSLWLCGFIFCLYLLGLCGCERCVVWTFFTDKQLDGQPLDEFVIELRKLAKNCQFASTDNEILTKVIQNCKSNRLRRRALREPDKTLDDLLTMGRALEMADH
jgi:hypothetical protein